jgi:hypothetical protein
MILSSGEGIEPFPRLLPSHDHDEHLEQLATRGILG